MIGCIFGFTERFGLQLDGPVTGGLITGGAYKWGDSNRGAYKRQFTVLSIVYCYGWFISYKRVGQMLAKEQVLLSEARLNSGKVCMLQCLADTLHRSAKK